MKWLFGVLIGFLSVLILLLVLAVSAAQSASDKTWQVEEDLRVHQSAQEEKEKNVVEDLGEIKKDLREIKLDIKELIKRN